VLCVRDNHGSFGSLSHLIILLFDHLLFARLRARLENFLEKVKSDLRAAILLI